MPGIKTTDNGGGRVASYICQPLDPVDARLYNTRPSPEHKKRGEPDSRQNKFNINEQSVQCRRTKVVNITFAEYCKRF